jgi:adenylate cyclase
MTQPIQSTRGGTPEAPGKAGYKAGENAGDTDGRARLRSRLHGAFQDEERRGLLLAAKVRSLALVVVIAWQLIDSLPKDASAAFELGELLIFLVLGLVQYFLIRAHRYPGWAPYVFVAADCIMLSVVRVAPNPFDMQFVIPAVVNFRTSYFVWYFLVLMQASFSLRPALVVWCGFSIVAANIGALAWVLSAPDVFVGASGPVETVADVLRIYLDPNFLSLDDRVQEMLAVILTAIGLAIVARRTRNFVESRSRAERARAKLARYFSPNMVDEISSTGGIGTAAQSQKVAVLFADIIGFTRLCEAEPADKVVDLLRDYHGLLANMVFRYDGTVDKYMGDGLMATFGTPHVGAHDATDALRCALDMVEAGGSPVAVGVGLHYGPAVVGDIGDERRLEFAVIGDTVNVASRVEHLTRALAAPLTVSDDLVEAVRGEADGARANAGDAADAGVTDDSAALLEKLTFAGPHTIRGRQGKIGIWTLAQTGDQLAR